MSMAARALPAGLHFSRSTSLGRRSPRPGSPCSRRRRGRRSSASSQNSVWARWAFSDLLRVILNGIAEGPELKGAQAREFLDYDSIFRSAIDRLHEEGRYRVFVDILRSKGQFPTAHCFGGNGPKPITVWCS